MQLPNWRFGCATLMSVDEAPEIFRPPMDVTRLSDIRMDGRIPLFRVREFADWDGPIEVPNRQRDSTLRHQEEAEKAERDALDAIQEAARAAAPPISVVPVPDREPLVVASWYCSECGSGWTYRYGHERKRCGAWLPESGTRCKGVLTYSPVYFGQTP